MRRWGLASGGAGVGGDVNGGGNRGHKLMLLHRLRSGLLPRRSAQQCKQTA
jgi:hypothetical protein